MKLSSYLSLAATLMLTPLTLVADEKEAGNIFPEWSFCTVYSYRDPDERDIRPNGQDQKDETQKQKINLPSQSILSEKTIIDVASLAGRVTGSRNLERKQGESAISSINNKQGQSYPIALCYQPHHAFVFYSDLGMPVACIEVCFGCLVVKTVPSKNVQINSGELGQIVDFPTLAKILYDSGLTITPYKSLDDYLKDLQKSVEEGEAYLKNDSLKNEEEPFDPFGK